MKYKRYVDNNPRSPELLWQNILWTERFPKFAGATYSREECICVNNHTGQCKRTGRCFNELMVAFFSTGGGKKVKNLYLSTL